jgi:hypothetical protein
MTDRELLEAAARAAGIEVWWNGRTCFVLKTKVATHEWNPLTSDADALRLAVRLRMTVKVTDYGAAAYKGDLFRLVALDEDITVETATRRAIVRAAAEIGRSKT